jgi:mannose-1-phosphate guanylyltransferase/mannose-6-phosphate isomerase
MKKQIDFKIVILAGGSAPGLWPESRELLPWQFQKDCCSGVLTARCADKGVNSKALSPFERTARFAESMVGRDSILVLADKDQAYGAAYHQLKEYNVVCEPDYRETAISIELACMWALNESRRSVVLVMPAGFVPENESVFNFCLQSALEAAAGGSIAAIGFLPDTERAAKGYLLQTAESSGPAFKAAYAADRPAKGGYYTYERTLVFKPEVVLAEIKKDAPAVYDQLNFLAGEDFSTHGIKTVSLEKYYGKIQSRSFGKDVLSKSENLVCVPCAFRFNTCYDWKSVFSLSNRDASNNIVSGSVINRNSRNSLIKAASRTVAAVGLDNMAVIETADAVFVSPISMAGEAYNIAEELRKRGDALNKEHTRVERPWGSFTVLLESPAYKIKIIEVLPGEQLSLQLHHKRDEYWTFVRGEAEIVIADKAMPRRRGESAFIPREVKHAVKNIGADALQFIEVEIGEYFGEDDTVRFADIYGREDDIKEGVFN